MRIPTRPRQLGVSLRLTPLIDIVFLLVIFFLVASHVARSESQEPVELPSASRARDDVAPALERLVITITDDETLLVAGKPVGIPEIEQALAQHTAAGVEAGFEVRIRGDRRVEWRVVEPIMLACARAGITRVGYAVLPVHRR